LFDIPSFVWGLGSSSLALVSLVPYIFATLKGTNRPHIFTWIIWSILTGIAFAVQYIGGAGAGAWATGVTFICCLLILAASVKNGEKNITRMDWICFLLALLALPVWLATKSPAAAAIWVTAIDGLAYIPTIRKAWHKPQEEMIFAHMIANVKHILSLLAMDVYSIATALYPISLIIFNAALVTMLFLRRRAAKAITS
jgi:hypothetical protein